MNLRFHVTFWPSLLVFAFFILTFFGYPGFISAVQTTLYTRIPSEVGGSQGLAVQIDIPEKPRYEGVGAPVAVYIVGGFRGDGIGGTTGRLFLEGFVEVRFNFPGSGVKEHVSGGVYDNRGPTGLKAARDVIRFALGQSRDFDGKKLGDITAPVTPLHSNVGLIGYSYGGVTNICVAGVHGSEVSELAWIVNWESPVGDGMPTAEAGAVPSSLRPFNPDRNPAYNPNDGTWDLSSLAYDGNIRIKVMDNETEEVSGGLYFDFNRNRVLDRGADFIPYPLVFKTSSGYSGFYSERLTKYAYDHSIFPSNSPPHIMSVAETNAFWEMRNGEYWIDEAVQKIPGLMFLVCASETDHVQSALDHPHVLIQYEGFRKMGTRFVRLNPDQCYVEYILKTTAPGAADNEAMIPFDHQSIRSALEPGDKMHQIGLASVPGAACELADRTQFSNLIPQLNSVIEAFWRKKGRQRR